MASNKRRKTGPRHPPAPKAACGRDNNTLTVYQTTREAFVCDPNMFVDVAWSWGEGGHFMAGSIGARLGSFCGNVGDKHAKWRPNVKLVLGYDGKCLMEVPGYDSVIPEQVRVVLEANADVFVDSNLGMECTAECVRTSKRIVLLVPNANGVYDVSAARDQIPPGVNYGLLIGTVTLRLRGQKTPTAVLAFRACTAEDDVGSMLHPKWLDENGIPKPQAFKLATPRARAADAHGSAPFAEVPLCGGPQLRRGTPGAIVMTGRSEARILQVEYDSGGERLYASIDSDVDLTADMLQCKEMVDENQLHALVATGEADDPTLLKLLNTAPSERIWMRGTSARWLGWRDVVVPQEALVGVRVAVHQSVAAELATVMDPTTFDTFALGARGKVCPLRPVSDGEAVSVVQGLVLPNPEPVRRLAKVMLQQAVIDAASAASATDPLVVTVDFCALWMNALPVRLGMQRSCEGAHLLLHIFTTDADFMDVVGFEAWPARTSKSKWGMQKVCIPPIDDEYLRVCNAAMVFGVRGVKGLQGQLKEKSKHEINFMEYNSSTQKLTLQLSVSRFANSKKVGGASVGQPPAHLKGRAKYVLGQGYVDISQKVPTPAQLQHQFARPTWNHW